MALDVRKLGVTLRSTSGTMAYAEEIYDETQGKFQSAINKELAQSIGAVNVPVKGVKSGDKVLSLADSNLSATLGLAYVSASKKIQLTGIGGAEIASIDATDFVKDKVVSSAELVETAEAGVSVAVPYIKLVFNDASTPIRFSVKSLVDVYTGANLKLSTAYATTAGVAPANGVSVDASIKNIATRLGTVEGKTYVDSIGGKKGAITLNSGSTTTGQVNFAIDTNGKISATVVDSDYAKSADVATAYATKTDLQNAQKTLGDDIATNTTNIGTNTTNIAGLQSTVESLTEEQGNGLNEIGKGTDGAYVTTTVSAKASKKQTIGVSVKTQAVASASTSADGLATANDVKTYVTSNGYQGIEKGTDGSFVTTTVSTKASNKQKVSVAVSTHDVSTATAGANGLATAYDVKQNCLMATIASDTEYDDWEAIVGGTTSTTSVKA